MTTRVVFPGALDLLEHRAREGTCASSHATTGRRTRIGVTRGLVRHSFVQHNLIDNKFQLKLDLMFEDSTLLALLFHALDPSKSSDFGSQMHIRVYADTIQDMNSI